MPKLFVYGTLMRGCKNHSYLEDAKFITVSKCEGFDLYDFPDRGYPGMYHGTGIVWGEIYDVDDFTKLDEFEGDEYERTTITCEKMEVYTYMCKIPKESGIQLNLWVE